MGTSGQRGAHSEPSAWAVVERRVLWGLQTTSGAGQSLRPTPKGEEKPAHYCLSD